MPELKAYVQTLHAVGAFAMLRLEQNRSSLVDGVRSPVKAFLVKCISLGHCLWIFLMCTGL